MGVHDGLVTGPVNVDEVEIPMASFELLNLGIHFGPGTDRPLVSDHFRGGAAVALIDSIGVDHDRQVGIRVILACGFRLQKGFHHRLVEPGPVGEAGLRKGFEAGDKCTSRVLAVKTSGQG